VIASLKALDQVPVAGGFVEHIDHACLNTHCMIIIPTVKVLF